SIDRDAYNQALLGGTNDPINQPYKPGYIGYDDSLPSNAYDPELAKQLIEESGVEDPRLTIATCTVQQTVDQATRIRAMFAETGVELEVVTSAANECRNQYRQGATDMFAAGALQGVDPSTYVANRIIGTEGPSGGGFTPPAELLELTETAAAA